MTDLFAEIDKRINWKSFYSNYLQGIKDVHNGHFNALCCFHTDKEASLSINEANGTYKCFACGETGNALEFLQKQRRLSKEDAVAMLKREAGIQDEDKPAAKKTAKLTVAEYAQQKRLPADWLRDAFRMGEKGLGIELPYLDESAAIPATRQRYTGKKFSWKKGSKLVPYGLWLLEAARTAGHIIFVEGESDTQTLTFYKQPANGIPGATTFKTEWAKYYDGLDIYIHNEGDAGGEAFLKQCCHRLAEAKHRGRVFEISCQVFGVKDPNELHKMHPDTFLDKWAEIMANAKQLDLASLLVKPDHVIPGAPVQLRIPNFWRVNEQGIFWINNEGDKILVCPVPILLSKRLRGIETGEEKIEIVFLREGTWHKVVTLRSTLFQTKSITSLADRGLPVTSENARRLVKFLGELEAENMDILELARAVDHLGWVDGKRFIPGHADDVILDVDGSTLALANAYHQMGEPEDWLQLGQILRGRPVPRMMLAASFGAPLLQLLNHRVFLIHSWGPSRGGKTAALKGALSVWGDPDGLVASFNATKTALERLAGFYSDLPLGVDERQVVGDKQNFIESLVYLLGMGKGKARGAKNGGLQAFKAWRTIAITTGEEPLSGDQSQTGVKTRVLELWGQPFDDEAAARKVHLLSGQHYGWAGPKFIECLLQDAAAHPGQLRKDYEALVEHLQAKAPDAMGSHITALAVCCLADCCSSQWIFGLTEGEAQDQALALAETALQKLESAAALDYSTKALEWVESWLVQNISKFRDNDRGDRYGEVRADLNRIYILPSALEPALKTAGFNSRRVLQDFADQGLIDVDKDRKRFKMTVRIDGHAVKAVALRLEKLSEQEAFW